MDRATHIPSLGQGTAQLLAEVWSYHVSPALNDCPAEHVPAPPDELEPPELDPGQDPVPELDPDPELDADPELDPDPEVDPNPELDPDPDPELDPAPELELPPVLDAEPEPAPDPPVLDPDPPSRNVIIAAASPAPDPDPEEELKLVLEPPSLPARLFPVLPLAAASLPPPSSPDCGAALVSLHAVGVEAIVSSMLAPAHPNVLNEPKGQT